MMEGNKMIFKKVDTAREKIGDSITDCVCVFFWGREVVGLSWDILVDVLGGVYKELKRRGKQPTSFELYNRRSSL